uniref:Uncharacterized protein n=1 Tax=Candidatus Kentrum sp. SD TaxID=2126332 RepID=A0A451BP32_9GAMM|nr:MAG: hypothetical protein BECKSD772D_GA0070982_108014 [Candidatus Kentron sp. SD]
MKAEALLADLSRALIQLTDALAVRPEHDVIRAGCIQYFAPCATLFRQPVDFPITPFFSRISFEMKSTENLKGWERLHTKYRHNVPLNLPGRPSRSSPKKRDCIRADRQDLV